MNTAHLNAARTQRRVPGRRPGLPPAADGHRRLPGGHGLISLSQPKTLEDWGQQIEFAADLAIRHSAPHAFSVQYLPKAYRGRCQERQPVKVPFASHMKQARQGEYNPECEVLTMATKRCVKQLRRVQSLQRRLSKYESKGTTWFRTEVELQRVAKNHLVPMFW